MATLVSPGVDVQIIDESFYSSAGPGTVPLIIIATAANKTAASGGTAPYTIPSMAGSLYLATSQRELVQNYGVPTFQTVQGTPVQGSELNEYGLDAAYKFLGISNRAYVLRADIDLAALQPSTTAPVGNPLPGTYWFDLSETSFGVFQSSGNANPGLAWSTQPVLIAAEGNVVPDGDTDVPNPAFGNDGDFAVVVTMSDNLIYEKIDGAWYQTGSDEWAAKRPTTITGRTTPNNIMTTDTIVITSDGQQYTVAFDTTLDLGGNAVVGTGALDEVVANINAAAIPNVVATNTNDALVIKDTTGADITIGNGAGTPLTTLGIVPNLYRGVKVYFTNNAQYPANSATGSVWIKGSIPNKGALWKIKLWSNTGGWTTVAAPFYAFNSSLNDGVASKDQAATAAFGTPLIGTVYVGFDADTGVQQLRRWSGLRWENLSYEAGTVPPTTAPASGTYWYNADFRADIMYGDGTQWVGYKRKYTETDPEGVLFAGTAPLYQSDGTELVDNDLWVDTSDLENYPMLYRYDATAVRWNLIDKTDQTTPFGIAFADARQNSGTNYTGNPNPGTYAYNSEEAADMLASNFVDPDAPDARTYPDGILMFNTRYATYNVKEWMPNYFKRGGFDENTDYTITDYHNSGSAGLFPALASAGRWVTASGNKADGTPYMGRKAQRLMIVRAMAEMIAQNEDIRSELVYFNLIAAPGYPELMDEMVALNTDQKEVAFVVGDTPIRLAPGGTTVSAWAGNTKNAPSTGEDGLTVANPYVGVYYPWGLGTDLSGNEVMIPPSTMALNTIAYNDQVAYQWYAPAGYRRGLVTNASSVGYLTSEGEFKPVILNQGQRDVLYSNKINPIAYIPGRGLVVYGQKTLHSTTTALDRINVARLSNYLKYNLDNIVKPFLFEQNDEQTRSSAQATVESFLNGLVGLRALEDYVVLCDESNNTPTRRDRNELWIDIAIKPLKAVEFIYIPVRIVNSSADLTDVSTTFV
jgi:hypothetical protein